MRVIGTAGHVDHGKSTLVQALTGVHPDRLKEEREREMTIDLGFAWFNLPGGEEIGIVDVPGHRDFIENMLAGVGGIDAVIFVVAADEGVMPQTREHLAILDLLQIQAGVVALTKIDMVPDEEWLELVEADVQDVLAGTVLQDAAIVRVSGKTGAGVANLISEVERLLGTRPQRPNLGRPRLSVDRVFTMPGFGTVATGTLIDGIFSLGDEVEVWPRGIRGRVRGLQTHKKMETLAIPGSRTAINISGVDVTEIDRGDVLTHPGTYKPSGRIDTRFRLLSDVNTPLEHNTEAKLYLGASEIIVRIRLLGVEVLEPGAEAWLQLESRDPVVAVRGDRYILRRLSPGETLGGGFIVDPHPGKRHKRFAQNTLDRLSALAQGSPADILFQALLAVGISPVRDVVARANLDEVVAGDALEELQIEGHLVILEREASEGLTPKSRVLISSTEYWQQMRILAVSAVDEYHQTQPLRSGMPREELKSRLKLPVRPFNALMADLRFGQELVENGPIIARPGHTIQFSAKQQTDIEQLLGQFRRDPYSPPSIKDCIQAVGEPVYQAMVEIGHLKPVSTEVVFDAETYLGMIEQIRTALQKENTLTAAQVRDRFNTSRKYVLGILEHMDSLGITVREGDIRRLK